MRQQLEPQPVAHNQLSSQRSAQEIRPEPRCRADASGRALDAVWFHRSIGVCNFLAKTHVLSDCERALVTFGIMWAPHGGSDAEDLFVTFGLTRSEYLSLIFATLAPAVNETKQTQNFKRVLHNDLSRAWATYEDPASQVGEGVEVVPLRSER